MRRDGQLERRSDPTGDAAASPDETSTSIVFGRDGTHPTDACLDEEPCPLWFENTLLQFLELRSLTDRA